MRTLPNCNSFFSKQGTSQEVCTGIFDGTGNLTHYNWDPNKIHPYTIIWNGIILLATCFMFFVEIGRHRAPKQRAHPWIPVPLPALWPQTNLNVPTGIGIKAPENLESAVLNLALTALIVLNQTSYIFYWKK